MSRLGRLALIGFLLAYLSWLAFRWIPLRQELVGDVLLTALTWVAALVAWRASRRAPESRRLRLAWRLVALAVAGQALGGVAHFYEYVIHQAAYPTVADLFYLSFYPLMLAAILAFPTTPRSARQAGELALDCAIFGLGGGAVFMYFVLGPDAVAGSTPLEAAASIAYPVGDLILLVGLSAALLRHPLPQARKALRLLTAAIGLFVVADLIFGYVVLHGAYRGGDSIDAFYALAFACVIVAASAQRAVSGELRATPVGSVAARVSWLPYVAVAACLAIVVAVERDQPFFPQLGIVLITALAMALVVVRQILSLSSVRQGRARLAQAQELAQIGSWEWDVDRDRVERSDEQLRLYGVDSASPATSGAWLATVHPGDRERVEQAVGAAIRSVKPFVFEMRVVLRDGDVRSHLVCGDVKTRRGRVVRLHGTDQDITDRKRMEVQLKYQADHDPLTGLYNRRRFAEELDRVLRYSSRYRRQGAILMLDVDNFKVVNDTNGHAAGDIALKSVASAIGERARGTDVVARLGGDEFAILLPEVSRGDALLVAEDIRASLGAQGREPPLHLSGGIALFDGTRALVADDLLIAADIALYGAKESGRDRLKVYDGEDNAALTWVERIGAALTDDRFVLYSQPMIDLASGKVTHNELLIRMVSDAGEIVPPSAFLPTAERFGLINDIDRWVVDQGLKLARQGTRVSVNLSAASIGDERILVAVRAAIADGADPNDVIFEITETGALSNMEAAQTFVATLSALGCHVALDDFGTGFGTFSSLKHLPTRYLKIDMEFVHDIVTNAADRQVVKSITDIAHTLGKQTIAEGVESDEVLQTLKDYGVDGAQGFFIGHPERISPLTRFERELAQQRSSVSTG